MLCRNNGDHNVMLYCDLIVVLGHQYCALVMYLGSGCVASRLPVSKILNSNMQMQMVSFGIDLVLENRIVVGSDCV